MVKKRIFEVVLALVYAVSFATAGVVSAGTPSASEQEKNAHQLMDMHALIPRPDRSDVQAALSDILPLQRRICKANGITLTNQPFQRADDYKTMMRPVLIGLNGDSAAAPGAGYVYIALGWLFTHSDGHLNGELGVLKAENTLSHEFGHNLLGHTLRKNDAVQREYDADIKGINLVKKLPEGGWGIHLLASNISSSFTKNDQQILEFMRKETKQAIGFTLKQYGTNAINDPLCHITVYYDSGKDTYPLAVSKQYSRNAYYGGQIAYCIAQGILSPANLRIVPNSLKYELKWDADCLLVCNDKSLPNGYRILTGLKGNQTQLQNELDRLRSSFGPTNQAGMSDYYNNTFGPRIYSAQGTELGKLILWETVAVAYDFTHR